ncbi:MAG TPA: sterol desaturase family protein [Verrucomicrobiae bacterium]|nr:sterol desaturase family protein [Verrucomicrobiae bacterium]
MADWIVAQEPWLRLATFASLLTLLLCGEALWPRRAGPMRRRLRWGANLPLVAIGAALARFAVPLGVAGTAVWARQSGFGVLNHVALPGWIEGVIAFALLDCLIYWQHRLLHQLSWLWPLHRMHHSDVEFDATTGLRFHPLEILLSLALKVAAVIALGAPPVAVIVFEIALNAGSLFSHANLALSPRVDARLRKLVVTPDMHRVHHSVHRDEHDCNYGFSVPWWDWWFGSYAAQPREGHERMLIGQQRYREDGEQKLASLLAQPLR